MTGDDSDHDESVGGESPPTRKRTTPLDADAAFDLLADAERRAILTYLRDDADGTATTAELLDCVCGRRDGNRGGEEEAEEHPNDEGEQKDALDRDRAAVRLHHEHLPKLADAGVVEYDERSETVRYWGNSFLEALLDAGQTVETARATDEIVAEAPDYESG